MTWNEFKKHVDDQLEAQGLSPDSELWYIDIVHPAPGRVDVAQGDAEDILVFC